MPSAIHTVVPLLAAVLLLGTGPSSLTDAMPYSLPGSREATLDEAAAPDGSGSEELPEKDLGLGVASGDGDDLLPSSERSAVWTRTLESEETDAGSGDVTLLIPNSATEKGSDSEEDPAVTLDLDPQRTGMLDTRITQSASAVPTTELSLISSPGSPQRAAAGTTDMVADVNSATEGGVSQSTDSTPTTRVTAAAAVTLNFTEAGSATPATTSAITAAAAVTLNFTEAGSATPATTSAASPVMETADVSGARSEPRQFCSTTLTCVVRGWGCFLGSFLLLLVLRSVCSNGVSAARWCYQLPCRWRQSETMKAIEFVNIGMDKKSWENKTACSLRIKAEIEVRLRQLFSRCDVTLEMVGSLSSRLGKSLNARPEGEDSLQEYRFTEPMLGADADFMVVLQVPVAPMAAGGRELPWHMLEGVAPYLTLSPFTRGSGASGPPLRRLWAQEETGHDGPLDVTSEVDIELQEFTPCPDAALSVCPVWDTPSPQSQPLSPRTAGATGGGDAFRWPAPGPVTSSPRASQNCTFTTVAEDDSVSLAVDRTDPDGETFRITRSVSLSEVPTLLRLPTLEASRGDSTPPGFARVQLFLDRVLPEDRHWWRDAMSEKVDGALYLSSQKARRLMRDMFETLELTVEPDRRSMSVVDSCVADYRGDPSYIKDVKARGPAVTLKLTQSDDRSIANMTFFQNNSCCYWICLCIGVILLLPFFVWIFLTGGSWPVRKCSGGACCSIFYTVTLLLPLVLVLPVLLLVWLIRPELVQEAEFSDPLHMWLMIVYFVLFAFCGSLFVCVSQCFFKLPTIFYGDFVTALVCPQWPRDARRFKTRSRQWPPRAEVDGIVRQGCHLVPKPPVPCRCLEVNGEAPCTEAHLLWRYSFSKAEVRLSKSIPEHYRRAYMALKWLVKKYITRTNCPTYGVGSNMRSYYIKTVLFWELDQEGMMDWSEGVEEVLLSRLAQRMRQHIQRRHLPHFFIPKINLLDELTQTDFENVERLMDMILENPAPLINLPELKMRFCAIGLCEAVFCTPGRDFRSELCCNYASRLHSVW